ncbi:putative F-box/FBD/LRR-repeat protein At1g78760 [Andrographis paniculata]|uniref:putative F-box/FBD/LRR-repeat protein At1g78760 n=1 Tax=Andrographis paniculata TaxID=175694 RepID=UPI0021E85D44|nr:putative F-box/FBD/LRR-repeat protein At1g78760 [Andrographis paniculata]XP_051150276.1 putative F-box/FBD/LRR-repeat protein At1g78760 [Andrographis paniculata]XP_051150277.1 putative F-box/FBD/LRR-repeat protein At1g78760 [Andrographis paniculata]
METDDRLGPLPQEIQRNILSLLPTTDVAKVGLMSRSLRQAWRSIPILNFDYSRHDEMQSVKDCYEEFINNTLARHDESTVENFEIRLWPLTLCDISIRNEWIQFAATHNSRKLVLFGSMIEEEIRVLPQTIFSCQHLLKLELAVTDLVLTWPDTFVLPNLRKLILKFAKIPASFMDQLSCFPVVEKLSMILCDISFTGIISVSSFTLTELIMCDCWGMEKCSVVLQNVPNLSKFIYICNKSEGNEFHVPAEAFQLVINDSISFVKAQTPKDLNRAVMKVIKELFCREFFHRLREWFIEYLSRVPDLQRQLSFTIFHNLVFLKIRIWPVTEQVRVVMQLTGPCPNLGRLSVFIVRPSQREEADVANVDEVFLCDGGCQKLYHVDIDNFIGNETEMYLARCLLANTPRLRRLLISFSLGFRLRDIAPKMNRVRGFDKASPDVNVYLRRE